VMQSSMDCDGMVVRMDPRRGWIPLFGFQAKSKTSGAAFNRRLHVIHHRT
jgi:hypothetical protein